MFTFGPIPPRLHGAVDYLYASALIFLPPLLAFESDAALWIAIGLGMAALLVALCTDWSTGLVGLIPPSLHAVLDIVVGAALIAAPFVAGFYDDDGVAFAFFLALGAGGLVFTLLTRFVRDDPPVADAEQREEAGATG